MKLRLFLITGFGFSVPFMLPAQKVTKAEVKAEDRALALYSAGSYAEAEKAFRDLIAKEEKKLGPENATTLGDRDNLGMVLHAEGKNAESEKIHREVLAVRLRLFGPQNPDTLISRNNLAGALSDQGKYAEAEKEMRIVVEQRTRILGPNDPKTLSGRLNLANVLNGEGQHAAAEAEDRALIPLMERALGPQNPSVLSVRISLSDALNLQGKCKEAEQEGRKTLAILEKTLGPDHALTLMCRSNVAESMQGQGLWLQADPEHRAVLAAVERHFGVEYPQALTACYDLALCLVGEKNFPEALAMSQRAEAGQIKSLGAEHPDTIKTRQLRERIESVMKSDPALAKSAGPATPAVAGRALDAQFVGHYKTASDPEQYLDLRADGTFTLVQGPDLGGSGNCTVSGKRVTLVVPGQALTLEITDGAFVGPDGAHWKKVPGAPTAPPPANLPNFANGSVPAPTPGGPAPAQPTVASREQVQVLMCENNMKMLIIMSKIWATKHKGAFPDDLADLFTPDYITEKKEDVLKVLMATDEKSGGYLYYGKKRTEPSMPDTKILILTKWKDAQGRHVVGRKNGVVELAVPTKDDYPGK